MANSNHLTLAVAGSGKTQGIVDACSAAHPEERILVLTYTSTNQQELIERLGTQAGDHHNVEVSGWFSFLMGSFVRPYLPFAYPGQRLQGFDFKSAPQQGVANEEWNRYFNQHGEARKVHLAQLAHRVNEASENAPIRRLERVYSRIFIDEVQDLCGWDLEVLRLLMSSSVSLEMVGDVRQAIIVTNERETKNSPYKYMKIWDWFQKQEKAGRLSISHKIETKRCRPEIVSFADSLFSEEKGFQKTVSQNTSTSHHDGLYLVREADVDSYMQEFSPLLLRRTKTSGKYLDVYSPLNIGKAKGLGSTHVLIYPTGEVKKLLQKGTPLEEVRAAYLYVAVTRARQSVAFILDSPKTCNFPYWSPTPGTAARLGDSG